MTEPRVCGIDPGVHGGIALYLPGATVPTVPNGLANLPVVDGELNYTALRDILWGFKPDIVFMELSTGFSPPGRRAGATSMFKFGGAFYSIKAVVACLDLPIRIVTPAKWKKHFGLKGGAEGKEQARQFAIERYPSIAPFLKFKNTHQKAEAFLIAAYGVSVMEKGESHVATRNSRDDPAVRDDQPELDIPE